MRFKCFRVWPTSQVQHSARWNRANCSTAGSGNNAICRLPQDWEGGSGLSSGAGFRRVGAGQGQGWKCWRGIGRRQRREFSSCAGQKAGEGGSLVILRYLFTDVLGIN